MHELFGVYLYLNNIRYELNLRGRSLILLLGRRFVEQISILVHESLQFNTLSGQG